MSCARCWLAMAVVVACLAANPVMGCGMLRPASPRPPREPSSSELLARLQHTSLGPALLVVSVVRSGPSRRGVLVVDGVGRGRLLLDESPGAASLDLVAGPSDVGDPEGWLAALVVALSPLAMGRDRVYEPAARGQPAHLKVLQTGRLVMVLRLAESDGLPDRCTWCVADGRPRWQVSLRLPWSRSSAGRAPDALDVRRVTAGLEDLPEPVQARLIIHEVREPPGPWDPRWLEPGTPLPEG